MDEYLLDSDFEILKSQKAVINLFGSTECYLKCNGTRPGAIRVGFILKVQNIGWFPLIFCREVEIFVYVTFGVFVSDGASGAQPQ